MGLGLAQPKAQLIWAGPGRPKLALGRKILAQTHLYRDGFGFGPAQGPTNLGWAGPKNFGPNPSLNELIKRKDTENFEQSIEDNKIPDDELLETDPLKIEFDIKSEPSEVDPLTFVVEN